MLGVLKCSSSKNRVARESDPLPCKVTNLALENGLDLVVPTSLA